MGRWTTNAVIPPGPGGLFVVAGGVILAAVVLYYAFMAFDGMGLAEHEAVATVRNKEHRDAGRSYRTQIIGNRPMVIPQTTGETYLLDLDIDGVQVRAFIDRAAYDALDPGDRVHVTYQRRRLTGGVQVVRVTR